MPYPRNVDILSQLPRAKASIQYQFQLFNAFISRELPYFRSETLSKIRCHQQNSKLPSAQYPSTIISQYPSDIISQNTLLFYCNSGKAGDWEEGTGKRGGGMASRACHTMTIYGCPYTRLSCTYHWKALMFVQTTLKYACSHMFIRAYIHCYYMMHCFINTTKIPFQTSDFMAYYFFLAPNTADRQQRRLMAYWLGLG